jgi:hypothetical protein
MTKTPVLGMVERSRLVRASTVPDKQHKTLIPNLRDSLHHERTVYTDVSPSYTASNGNVHTTIS